MIEDLHIYAKKNNVPIILDEGLEFMLNYIKENRVKTILEVGTAIGYSAINMALLNKDIKVVTIERDKAMYDEAIKNIRKFNLSSQIEVVFIDALEYIPNTSFDLIFIDAAKSQYIKFFERFSPFLNKDGAIITDNLKFHGYVDNPETITSKNLKGIIRKLNNYIEFLRNNEQYKTTFYDIGDGLSITKSV